ncbi:MAG: NusG domain II-containing protein [Cellulosilyticaceae bacterium]
MRFIMKKGNIIALLLFATIIIGSIATLYIMKHASPTGPVTAIISQNGNIIKTISLSTITKEETFVVENDHGGINVITAIPGSIAFTEANCPDQLCVERGFITSSILPAVCLPNGVTIEIKNSESTKEEVDIIVQ